MLLYVKHLPCRLLLVRPLAGVRHLPGSVSLQHPGGQGAPPVTLKILEALVAVVFTEPCSTAQLILYLVFFSVAPP